VIISCSEIRYLNSLLKDICQKSIFLINCKCLGFDSCWCVLTINTSGFKYIHFNSKLAMFYYDSLLQNCKNIKRTILPVDDTAIPKSVEFYNCA